MPLFVSTFSAFPWNVNTSSTDGRQNIPSSNTSTARSHYLFSRVHVQHRESNVIAPSSNADFMVSDCFRVTPLVIIDSVRPGGVVVKDLVIRSAPVDVSTWENMAAGTTRARFPSTKHVCVLNGLGRHVRSSEGHLIPKVRLLNDISPSSSW